MASAVSSVERRLIDELFAVIVISLPDAPVQPIEIPPFGASILIASLLFSFPIIFIDCVAVILISSLRIF